LEANLGGFALGLAAVLCFTMIIAMIGFGPDVLEWIEGNTGEN
jgi:hypothetical protein